MSNNNKVIIDIDVDPAIKNPSLDEIKQAFVQVKKNAKELFSKFYSAENVEIARRGISVLEGLEELTDDDKEDLQYLKQFLANYEELQEKWIAENTGESLEEYAANNTQLFSEIMKRAPLPDIHTYGIMNDNANKQLISTNTFKQELNGQLQLMWWEVEQAGKKSSISVKTYISLLYEGTETRLNKKMTAFDNAVYNAISTRFYYWKLEHPGEALFISPQEVWRTMNGKDDTARPSEKQVEKVIESIDKMRFTRCQMDINEELKSHYITINDDRVIDGFIDTYLLETSRGKFKTEKGRIVDGYVINIEPILYSYNKAKNHILYVDYDLLNTSDKKNTGEYTIEFTNYLLQRMQSIINGKLDSERILFDDLYEKTGIDPPKRRLNRANYSSDDSFASKIRGIAKQDRETVEAIFNSWIRKGKLIKAFKPVKKSNSVVGYDLDIINEPQKKQIAGK